MIQEPETVFSPWTPWTKRTVLRTDVDYGGVYIWARRLPGELDLLSWPELDERIIYIGETKNLNDRPLSRHNRIARYRKLFGDLGLSNLYVCTCRAFKTGGEEEKELRAFTQYLEDKIDWEFTRRYGRRPAMHFKEGKTGPKRG